MCHLVTDEEGLPREPRLTRREMLKSKVSDQASRCQGASLEGRALQPLSCPEEVLSRRYFILDISITTVMETLHNAFFIEKWGRLLYRPDPHL